MNHICTVFDWVLGVFDFWFDCSTIAHLYSATPGEGSEAVASAGARGESDDPCANFLAKYNDFSTEQPEQGSTCRLLLCICTSDLNKYLGMKYLFLNSANYYPGVFVMNILHMYWCDAQKEIQSVQNVMCLLILYLGYPWLVNFNMLLFLSSDFISIHACLIFTASINTYSKTVFWSWAGMVKNILDEMYLTVL